MSAAAALASAAAVCAIGYERTAGAALLIALVPLFVAVGGSGWVAALALGGLFGALAVSSILGWLWSAAAELQGGFGSGVLVLGAAAVAVHAAQFGVAVLPIRWLGRGGGGLGDVGRAFGCAAWWVVVDWLWPHVVPVGLGNLLCGAPWLRQAAELSGVSGLTFAVVLVNTLAAAAVLRWWRGLGGGRLLGATAAAATAVVALFGALRWTEPWSAGEPLRDGVVQAGLGNDEPDLALANAAALARHTALSRELHGRGLDLVVWPESSLKVYLADAPPFRAALTALAGEIDAPLLVGALDRHADGGELNAAFVIDAAAAAAATLPAYHKQRLLPFAEYVPAGMGALLGRGWRTTGEFVGGAAAPPLAIGARGGGDPFVVAPSICVEAVQPGAANALVRGGAQVLVNQTDDSWFAGTLGPDLHLDATRLRAVETRRWLVRASNSGISALIDPRGEVVASLPFGAVGVLAGAVQRRGGLTPYVRYGDWVAGVSGTIVAGTALGGLLRRLREGRPRRDAVG